MLLSASPLIEEVRRLHNTEQSGILALSCGGERVEVHFREGMIEAASSNLASRRLGDYLAKAGDFAVRDLDAVQVEARRQKILLGEAVLRKNILDQAEIGEAVRTQAADLFEFVLNKGFSVDSFIPSLRSYHIPGRMTLAHVLLELSRRNPGVFEPEAGSLIAVSDGTDLSVFPWYPQELSVLSELRSPHSFQDLLAATGLQEVVLKRILGVLQRLEILETLGATDECRALTWKPEAALEQFIPVVTNAVLNEKLEVSRDGSSFISEQFKNLKVQITASNSETSFKAFTVSSPETQDGKSLISVSLAFSFAMDPGRRVIIVDCDLRGPSLARYLGVTSEPGLLQYVANTHLSPYCFVRRVENLYFMTAGGTAPNPIEILSMQKMRQLIDHLKKDFHTIILDAPPYSPIADARIVTGLSDGLIMVIRRGKTSYESTDRAFKALDRKKLLGVVFNDVKPMLFHTYHSFGSYEHGSNRRPYSSSSKTRSTPKNYLES